VPILSRAAQDRRAGALLALGKIDDVDGHRRFDARW
jgi:hypothetical protein